MHTARRGQTFPPRPARPQWRLRPPSGSWPRPPHRGGTGAGPGGHPRPRTSDSGRAPPRRPLPPARSAPPRPGPHHSCCRRLASSGSSVAPRPRCQIPGRKRRGGAAAAGAGGAPARSPDRPEAKRKLPAPDPDRTAPPASGTGGLTPEQPGARTARWPHVGGAQSVTRTRWSGLWSGGIARSTSICIRANVGHGARNGLNSQPGRDFATWVSAFTGNQNPTPRKVLKRKKRYSQSTS